MTTPDHRMPQGRVTLRAYVTINGRTYYAQETAPQGHYDRAEGYAGYMRRAVVMRLIDELIGSAAIDHLMTIEEIRE